MRKLTHLVFSTDRTLSEEFHCMLTGRDGINSPHVYRTRLSAWHFEQIRIAGSARELECSKWSWMLHRDA